MNKAQYKAYRHNQKSRRVYYEEPLHYPKSTERQSREDIFFRKIPLDLGDIPISGSCILAHHSTRFPL